VLLAGLLAAAAAAGAAEDPLAGLLPGDPVAGSQLFVSRGCLRCHAVNGDGGRAAADLGRLTLKRPLLELAGLLWNHSPRMEAVFGQAGVRRPTFTPDEMASLLAFLYSLNHLDRPGDAAAGARLWAAKGCRTCHALGGSGGTVGPDLDRYARYASPVFLTAALWKNGPAMARAMREHGVPRPSFRDDDIPNLLAFIRAVGPPARRVYARPGNPARGAELFADRGCIQCHALRGEGGRVGPDLAAPGRLQGSLSQIAGAMWNHGPAMWAQMAERGLGVPALAPQELSDIVSYLYFFQILDRPGDPERGRALFGAKGCAACHPLTGRTPDRAPPLAEGEALATPLGIVTEMWNHAGKMDRKTLERNLPWPTLRGRETADLVTFILSAREPATAATPPPGKEIGRGDDPRGRDRSEPPASLKD
jgi:mono/diheme cytochrome c family protein